LPVSFPVQIIYRIVS